MSPIMKNKQIKLASLTVLLLRKRGILIPEENKKSEPFSYREKVRISMAWCE